MFTRQFRFLNNIFPRLKPSVFTPKGKCYTASIHPHTKVYGFLEAFNKRGFTLIEMMVVLTIIGILAGLTLTSFQGSRKTARDGKRVSDLQQIRSALEMYRADNNGQYPPTAPCPGDSWDRGFCATGGVNINFLSALTTPTSYLSKVPFDPINNSTSQTYVYRSYSSNSKYYLMMNPEVMPDEPDDCGGAYPTTWLCFREP